MTSRIKSAAYFSDNYVSLMPGETRTVSVAIFDHVQALDYGSAGATSLVLLAVSFGVLAATYALQGRVPSAWLPRSKPGS